MNAAVVFSNVNGLNSKANTLSASKYFDLPREIYYCQNNHHIFKNQTPLTNILAETHFFNFQRYKIVLRTICKT